MHSIVPPNGLENLWPFVLLYFSPESIMPLASAVAGAIGILLIFWRQAVRLARKAFRFVRARFGGQSPDPEAPEAAQSDESLNPPHNG